MCTLTASTPPPQTPPPHIHEQNPKPFFPNPDRPGTPQHPAAPRCAPLRPGALLCDGDGYPVLVLLPGGSFTMGGNKNSNEQPAHSVQVASFAIGRYPVTQAQWLRVMGSNPSHFKSNIGHENCPVECVSWDDAQAFIQKLNALTGHTSSHSYRLPSEAEWEYACRAGSTGEWCFGNDEAQLKEYAWYDQNSDKQTHPVGEKLPSAWGLHDLHGNVWEWCADTWHGNYSGAPADGSAWISGGEQNLRVLRGGCWGGATSDARCACRNYDSSGYRDNYVGFRLARTVS